MAKSHIDPHTHCIDCGVAYGPVNETCAYCGFNPIDKGEDEARQIKAESDFSAWQNERPDDND